MSEIFYQWNQLSVQFSLWWYINDELISSVQLNFIFYFVSFWWIYFKRTVLLCVTGKLRKTGRGWGRRAETETASFSTCSLPRWSQEPVLNQAEGDRNSILSTTGSAGAEVSASSHTVLPHARARSWMRGRGVRNWTDTPMWSDSFNLPRHDIMF